MMVGGERKKGGRGDVHLSPSPTSPAQTCHPLAHREHPRLSMRIVGFLPGVKLVPVEWH